MNKPLLTFSLILLISLVPVASANLSNTPWIPPTNANSKITTSNGTVHEMNYSSNYNFVGTGSATITGSNNSKTIYFNVPSSPVNNHAGTYNQTLANNVVKNSGGQGLNFINGTNNPITLTNDPTRNQINITISSTGSGGGGVTSLNALTGALTIACVAGNTTCTTSGGNTITVNTAYNIVTTGLSAQTITKALTLNNLMLGGNAAGGNKNFTGLNNVNGTKFFQNGTQVIDTLTQGSGISITGSGHSRTITNTGLLNAIQSVNSQTGPSITITRQPGYTVITNSTNNIKVGIDAAGVMELNGTQTASGSKTFNALVLGGDANAGSNGFTNAGHKSTFPLTTGTLCQTNQSSTCGTNSGVTSITGTAHNVTASSSTGAVTLNTGDNVVVTNGAGQNFTKRIGIVANKLFIQSTTGNPTIPSNTGLYIVNNDSTKFFIMDGYEGGSSSNEPNFLLRTANGILSSPTKTTSGLRIGVYGFGGYQQTTNAFTGSKAIMAAFATQDWTSTTQGSKLIFQTTPNGGTTLTTGLTIDQDQSTIFQTRQFWTPISDPVTAFTNAIWKSSTNTDVLKYRNNANTTTYNILSTLGAVTTSTPADPTGTTSTTAKMMGLAGSITPAVSTRLDITICGQMANSVINDGVTVQLRYGTGTAPANAAALTGTQLGASQTLTEKVAAQNSGFCVTGIATGLTIGTAYWIDAAVNAVTGGTASITGNTVKAHEI